eukprot:12687_1
MDSALLVIAANENCPQPQTSEHLAAIEIMKMKNLIILQNKVDLVNKKKQNKIIFKFNLNTLISNPIWYPFQPNADVISMFFKQLK